MTPENDDRVVGTDEFLENIRDIMFNGDGYFKVLPEQKEGYDMLTDRVVEYVRQYVVDHYQWKEDE